MGNKSRATDSGFSKKPVPLTMQVNADEIAEMQRGYEARLARQKMALDRMTELLDQRTQDVDDHMRRANKAAQWTGESLDDLAVINAVSAQQLVNANKVSDDELDELLSLIPDTWEEGEDEVARSRLAGYIKWMQEEVRHQKSKQVSLVRQAVALRVWVDNRTRGVGQFRTFEVDLEKDGFEVIRKYAEYLENEVIQARNNARHNARVANKVQAAIEVGDETPPWEDKPQSFTQPATHEHDLLNDEQPLGESETVDWDGSKQLPPGEDRPGSF